MTTTKPPVVDSNMRRSKIYMAGEPDIVFTEVDTSGDLSGDALDESRAQLFNTIERYFNMVAETLSENPKEQQEALRRLQKAKNLIWDDAVSPKALSEAQFEVHLVHVKIAKAQELRMVERRLRWVVPTIVFTYLLIMVVVIVLVPQVQASVLPASGLSMVMIPGLELPVAVVLWAAFGSMAAILYRFYHNKLAAGWIDQEIRWLIARPIIGIIMGSVAYLAVVSGVGSLSGTSSDTMTNLNFLIVVAFLGGFSDRFFESLLDAVVGKVTGSSSGEEAEATQAEESET